MNRYHILTAIEALDSMKYELHAKVERRKEFAGFRNAQYRELCLHREQEVAEALEAFKQLLTDPITTPVEAPTETQAEKPKITRPTGKDIERIRYELDRAVTIAEQVAKQSPLVAPTQPLFQVEAAMLLKSVYSALTEFIAVYPEEK